MSQDIIHTGARPFGDDPWAAGSTTALAPVGQKPQTGGNQPLQKLHRILRGRYIVAILVGLIGGAFGAYYGWQSEAPTYRASGHVEFQPFIPTIRGDTSDRVMSLYEQRMNSEAIRIRTREIATAAMNRPEWRDAGGRAPTDGAIGAFMGALKSDVTRRSFFINISFEHPDPKLATAGVRAVLNAFKDTYATSTVDNLAAKARAVEDALARIDAQITAQRNKLGEFMSKYGTNDLGKQHEALIDEASRATRAITTFTAQKRDAEAIKERALAEGGSPLSLDDMAAVDRTGVMRQLLTEKRALESQLNNLFTAGPRNPQLQALRERIANYETLIEAKALEIREYAFGVIPDLVNGNQIYVTQQLIDDFGRRIAFQTQIQTDANAKLKELSADRAEIDRIEREITRLQADLTKNLTTKDELEAQRVLSSPLDNIQVGETVVSNDKRKTMAVAGFGLGLAVPVALVLLLGLLDTRFRYSDDADGGLAGLKLLGILPNLPDRLSDPQQASIAAHCVHQIRTMLQLDMDRDHPTSFCITSASSGDGKTSLCLALGLSFAASGSRTLLIDADLVGGGLSNRLGRADSPDGILDALTGGELLRHIRTTDVQDLAILPVGQAHVQHAGVFSPSAMRKLIAEAKKHFEVIVIDTGPLMGAIEATPVCASVDGVILAVSRGQSRPLVEKSTLHLRSIGAVIAGVVFNRAQAKDFARSISGMSVRSAARSASNGYGHNRRDGAGNIGPVAGAVRTDVNVEE